MLLYRPLQVSMRSGELSNSMIAVPHARVRWCLQTFVFMLPNLKPHELEQGTIKVGRHPTVGYRCAVADC
jgi:hypothetical protein